eukprot:sb/3479287/
MQITTLVISTEGESFITHRDDDVSKIASMHGCTWSQSCSFKSLFVIAVNSLLVWDIPSSKTLSRPRAGQLLWRMQGVSTDTLRLGAVGLARGAI